MVPWFSLQCVTNTYVILFSLLQVHAFHLGVNPESCYQKSLWEIALIKKLTFFVKIQKTNKQTENPKTKTKTKKNPLGRSVYSWGNVYHRMSRFCWIYSKGIWPHLGCFLSFTIFSLFFPDIVFSDPAAIRIQTIFFFLSFLLLLPTRQELWQKENADETLQASRMAPWQPGPAHVRRSQSPGLPLRLFQLLPSLNPQYLRAQRGNAHHFPLFVFPF